MNPDATKLRVTRTNPAQEFQGSLFGLEIHLFPWLGAALLAAVCLFAGLYYGLDTPFPKSAMCAAVLVLFFYVYLRVGLQNRPPGFLSDLVDSMLTKGNAMPPKFGKWGENHV